MKSSLYEADRWSTLGMVLCGAFWAGSAWASRQNLDEAHASVAKAVQALQAEQPSEAAKPHVSKALGLLTRAQGEILKAKQVSSAPPAE